MGEVILGMPGPWADDCREESDHYTTKIGGLPDWPVRDMGIDPDVLNCDLCRERLCLVAQVYSPISTPMLSIEERVIYIFGCRMPKCGNDHRSWRAIRVQKCNDVKQIGSKDKVVVTPKEDFAPISKCNNQCRDNLLSFAEHDDDSDTDLDLEELGRALSAAVAEASQPRKQNSSLHSKDIRNAPASKASLVDADTSRPVIPCFYIYFQKAQSPSAASVVSASYSSLSIKGNESPPKADDAEERWEGEDYEYDRALGADRTYLKFKKQLDLFPEQCFRYSYGGKPLLATTNVVEPDTCKLCGASRQYELQLMSPLLYFLHEAADGSSADIPEEWSWMTLILYTCSSSCCPSSCEQNSGSCSWAVAEEAIVVQDE